MNEGWICVLCNKKFYGYGNNPQPLKESGKCCDDCNFTKVIPERMKRAKENGKN